MATATAHPRLDGMMAVGSGSKVKPLGFISWFSVPDENVSMTKLRRAWVISGLDPAPLPRDQRAVNVFRRAMREQEGRVRHDDGTVAETDVVEVLENEQDVIYQISRVARDVDEKVVNYPKAMRVVFSKVTGDLHFKGLGGVPRAELMPMMEEIQTYYDANTKTVTGAKVRTLVRNYIKHDSDESSGMVGLSGESMRGKAGGVYFVLAKYRDQLDSIGDMLGELYSPAGRAYLYAVPLADGATERELIRRHHVANTVGEIKAAMAEAADLLREERSRGVRSNIASFHWNRLQRLRRRAAQYADVLKDEQDEITDMAQMLNKQLRKLV